MLAALDCKRAIVDPSGRGIRQLFYFQVDNPLVDLQPRSISATLAVPMRDFTQVVAKRDPLEKVGNVVEVDGRLRIIEYSDLPEKVAGQPHCRRFTGDLGRQHRGSRDRR